MTTQEDIDKILNSNDEPEGVTVQAADGRLFFLSNEEASRLAIPQTKLYTAFHFISQIPSDAPAPEAQKKGGAPVVANPKGCGGIGRWLNHHSPHSAKWRRLCIWYFDNC
jgi:hypothetical protein